MLAVGVLDIVFTLPSGILYTWTHLAIYDLKHFPLFPDWKETHRSWAPLSIPASEWRVSFWSRFNLYLGYSLYVVLSIIVFLIFGLTEDARVTYRRWYSTMVKHLGFRPATGNEGVSGMVFRSPYRTLSFVAG